MLGRNAAFAVKSEVDVGRQLIVSTATATAVYCMAMPPPRVLEISRTIAVQDEEDHQVRQGNVSFHFGMLYANIFAFRALPATVGETPAAD